MTHSFKKPILFCENKEYLSEVFEFTSVVHNGVARYKEDSEVLKNRYSLVMSMLYGNPLSNFLILKAKLANIPTILVTDGIIEWNNMFKNPMIIQYKLRLFHPVLHDVFLCVGRDETDYFKYIGVNAIQFLPKRMMPSQKKLGPCRNGVFLITTANTSYFDTVERLQLVHLIKAVLQELSDKKEQFKFRIFDPYLIQELKICEDQNLIDCSFEEAISQIDFVITSPSSISYLAMYHGKPLAHLIYRDSPIFIQSGWNITSLCSLVPVINSMKSFNEERMVFQSFQVQKYSTNDDEILDTVHSSLELMRETNLKHFVDQNLVNLINSRFNFNFEYGFRKVYLKFKRFRIIQYLRSKMR